MITWFCAVTTWFYAVITWFCEVITWFCAATKRIYSALQQELLLSKQSFIGELSCLMLGAGMEESLEGMKFCSIVLSGYETFWLIHDSGSNYLNTFSS